jgi:serine/threonine-protein kinase HipA
MATEALQEIAGSAEGAFDEVEKGLPKGFPMRIHESIRKGFMERLEKIG